MSLLSRMLFSSAVCLAVGVQGAELGLQLEHHPSDVTVIESPGDEALAFWERFTIAFEERSAENFGDRLHPLGSLNWSLQLGDSDAEVYQDLTSRTARKALTRSFKHSLREASVDLPLMLWLKDRQSFLADFLRNSMGNVDEESVAPNELSYQVAERSWWDRLSESSGLRYGIRPFRTAPYAYAGIGIRDGDSVLLLANLRYVFRDFAEHKFELALSLPLPNGLAVDVGAAYEFERSESEAHIALKLFKKLENGGNFYIGMELRERPSVYAGLSFAL